ncbi:MAG: PilZ domain-containing protein, partial [Gammaproteobacteria bacterium]|nr:PilZ domain-containing protein [Gammaproteobacteria bacterium]
MVDHEKEQTLPPTPDKRQADRITTETPIILVDEKGREWITETIDISSSGIAFTVPKGCALNEGALLQVKIPV